ncbi:unnamed protein product [Orchesella dallaii]|uniref:F-box domain-containing protein n=1 Tax=Orchesella dallaii TaxID=48710 RepID=A0ABP1RGJ1_9HEXA
MEMQTNGDNWFFRIRRKFTRRKCLEESVHNIPPEMLEAFLEKISDQKTLLRCRLVSTEWKAVVDNLLEKRRLSLWTVWDPKLYLGVPCLSPRIWAVPQSHDSEYSTHLVVPPVIKGKITGNPFPQKSVAIIGFDRSHWDENRVCPELKHKAKVKLVPTLEANGDFLTSLIFHDMTLNFCDLKSVLNSMLLLKAITFSKIKLNFENEGEDLKISPHLTHLQLINCDPFVIKSVLGFCSRQLVSLKLVGLNGDLTVELKDFENLKQLFVYDVHGPRLLSLLKNTESPPPLEYLSVIRSRQSAYYGYDNNMENVVNFIYKISKSLIHLRMNIKLEPVLKLLQEGGKTFPNLRWVQMVCLDDNNWEECLVKEKFLHWFPKLESAKFISGQENGWYQNRDCIICENLASDKGPSVGHISIGGKRFYSTYLPFNRT